MDKIEKLIKEYLKGNLGLGQAYKTSDCPDEGLLVQYLEAKLDKEKYQALEYHIAGCGFCLSQLSIASQSKLMHKQGSFESVPQNLINKTKSRLGIGENKGNSKDNKRKIIKKQLFLLGAIIFFVLSFIFPKYFAQFLVGTLILGIRWAFESESGRTLIMVLDSWRHHSQDKDEEISHRLRK
jgi:hypothetical protein